MTTAPLLKKSKLSKWGNYSAITRGRNFEIEFDSKKYKNKVH